MTLNTDDPGNMQAAKTAVNEYNVQIQELYETLPPELKMYAALSSVGVV